MDRLPSPDADARFERGLPQLRGPSVRQRAASLVASAVLHVAIAAFLLIREVQPTITPEPPSIQVELVPSSPPPEPLALPTTPPDLQHLSLDPPRQPDYSLGRVPLRPDPSLETTENDGLGATGSAVAAPQSERLALPGDESQNYALVVLQLVRAQLRYPASAARTREKGIVNVSLEIGRDGSLLDVHAVGGNFLDLAAAAREAARAAAPFPSFPITVTRSRMVINFAIAFEYSEAK